MEFCNLVWFKLSWKTSINFYIRFSCGLIEQVKAHEIQLTKWRTHLARLVTKRSIFSQSVQCKRFSVDLLTLTVNDFVIGTTTTKVVLYIYFCTFSHLADFWNVAHFRQGILEWFAVISYRFVVRRFWPSSRKNPSLKHVTYICTSTRQNDPSVKSSQSDFWSQVLGLLNRPYF